MAGQRELKKRLRSINTTGQLASAMKTVSSAKFSRANAALDKYRRYAESCQAVMSQFGPALSKAMPEPNREAPAYYVVAASNRGLCGGYNSNLLSFAEDVFRQTDGAYRIVTIGRMAEAYYAEHGTEITRSFILPDVPNFEDCGELLAYLYEAYASGDASSVTFVYQYHKNMLTQQPRCKQILPMTAENAAPVSDGGDMLCIPDRETVTKRMCISMVNAVIYETVLECAAGAQAATMIAMREACDNAEKSGAALELEISRKRQSEVTASVIETYTVDSE